MSFYELNLNSEGQLIKGYITTQKGLINYKTSMLYIS